PVAVILGAAALAVAAAFGLGDLAGYHRVRNELGRLDPIWLAACFAGEVVAYLGYILAIRDTARVDGGPELGASAATRSVVPWLAVIPGGLGAVWLTSPSRARRYSDPGDGGSIRRGFAHTVAGLSILRSLLVAPPREHGLGLVGAALYWTGDIACLWAALQVY